VVEKRVQAMVWILWVVVDVEERTWNREQGMGDALSVVPTAVTPGVLQSEYHSNVGETCSDGGVQRQCR